MRVREPRRAVLVAARMRLGTSWNDVCIRNISSRGLMVTAAVAPTRGTYVEIRRGRHIIVARIVWTAGRCFGLHAQDRVPVEEIVAEPDRGSADFKGAAAARPPFDRRAVPRTGAAMCPSRRADRSRTAARAMEFASAAVAGGFLASLIALAVVQAIAEPMSRIGSALGDTGTVQQRLPKAQ